MRLGEVLRKWRRAADIPVREAAELIGVSTATLSRIERGEAMDGTTLAKVLTWLVGQEGT
jgi:transcriptional regulator with XRE-family HTH domain